MSQAREYILQTTEIVTQLDAFSFAYKVMIALNNSEITTNQFAMIMESLQTQCKLEDIGTETEFGSIFIK